MRSVVLAWPTRRGLVVVAVVCLVPAAAAAEVLHVDARAPDKGDGSAAKPLRSIKAALKKADNGVEIRVAEGGYSGTIELDWMSGGRELRVVGGFPGATTADYAAGKPGDFAAPKPGAHSTLRASEGKPVVNVKVVETDTSSRVELVGMELTGGQGVMSVNKWRGGAIYMPGGKLVLRDCVVVKNTAYPPGTDEDGRGRSEGGGLYAAADVEITGTTFEGNRAGRGGAMRTQGKLALSASRIVDNHGDGDHGGGVIASGDVTLTGNVFTRNVIGDLAGYGWGGGLVVTGAGTKGTLSWNTYFDNGAPTKGSGVFIDDEATVALSHELVYANRCGKDGGSAVYVDGYEPGHGSAATIDRSTIARHPCVHGEGNGVLAETEAKVTITRSIVWDVGKKPFAESKDGKITVDAETTVDPQFADPAAGDFHLRAACRWDGKAWVDDGVKNALVAAAAGEPGAYGDSAEASAAAACPGKAAPGPRFPPPPPLALGAPVAAKKGGGLGGCTVAPGVRAGGSNAGLVLVVLCALVLSRRRHVA